MSSCATSEKGAILLKSSKDSSVVVNYQQLKRPVPNSIRPEVPKRFKNAVKQGTRTWTGKPGPNYWKQESDYVINVKVLPDKKMVVGSETITYHNNSPNKLRHIMLNLIQNINKAGMPRKVALLHEVTEGFTIRTVSVDGKPLPKKEHLGRWRVGTFVNGTQLEVVPKKPVKPGETIQLHIEWTLELYKGAYSGSIGNDNALFLIASWYPKIDVYDDLNGWFTEQFLGRGLYNNEFGNYDVSITVPDECLVAATGSLMNAEEVLRKPVRQRLKMAYHSDKVIQVVGKENMGNVTQSSQSGWLTWNFQAERVIDFAFGMARKSLWDATRAAIGDIDGDGTTDYTHINVIYHPDDYDWSNAAKYAAYAISYESKYTGLSYPWSHMTIFDATGAINGGIAYPMLTFVSPYLGTDNPVLEVITHEVAHMWIPMQLATNGQRYNWMSEGYAAFSEDQIRNKFTSNNKNYHISKRKRYLGLEKYTDAGTIMRYTAFHYNYRQYSITSYHKPATILTMLRAMLGKKVFMKCIRTFFKRWRYKHPYPWDLFNTFEEVSGRELDWFWRSWYYESWVLDRGVAQVKTTDDGTQIVIKDYGLIPMPARVKITVANGRSIMRKIEVSTWLKGATQKILHIKADSKVTAVVVDPDHRYADINYSNNTWKLKKPKKAN